MNQTIQTDSSLKGKSITIKGKQYVQVKDRVVYFNQMYPNGRIDTKLYVQGDCVRITATVYPDVENLARYFRGHAESIRGIGEVNKTSPVENCETSAVGRALAMMGIGVLDSIASSDEMHKAGADKVEKASEAQINYISNIATNKGVLPDVLLKRHGMDPETITKDQASVLIKLLIDGRIEKDK